MPDGDICLVNAIWAPINELHNARAAEAAVTNASPAAACRAGERARCDARGGQPRGPRLHPEEALTRANWLLRAAVEARGAARTAALAAAHEQEMKVDADVFSRTALVPGAIETPLPIDAG